LNQEPIELQSIALPLSYTPIHGLPLQMVRQEMQSCQDKKTIYKKYTSKRAHGVEPRAY
jgi:hypothetical protein